MSVNMSPSEPTFTPSHSNEKFSAVRILAFLTIAIYFAELVAMLVLYYLQISNYLIASLVDGFIMLGLILPALYFLQLKPLVNQIQERTRAEMALRESEKLLKKVLELLPVGVWIVDKNGKVTHGNLASQDIWAGARYVGIQDYSEYKGWWPDSGKPIQPEEWAASRAIAYRESTLNEEVNIEAFDGTPKIILNSAIPIMDDANSLQGAVLVNQDITKRRQMEKTLLQKNELLERFFYSIHTLIAYMDRDFNFIRVNDAYANVAGHPVDFFVGKNHFNLYPDEENLSIFQRVVETGEPYIVSEKPFENPEFPERGVTYWDWSLQPVKTNLGEVEGVVLNLLEVTERKRAEIKLERQNQELRAASIAETKQRELAEGLVQATILLNSSLEQDQVLGLILEEIRKIVPFHGASIMLLEGKSMQLASFLGYEDRLESIPDQGKTFILADYPVLREVCKTKQLVKVDSEIGHAIWHGGSTEEWVRSFVSIPLLVSGDVIGLINLNSELANAFHLEAVDELLAFAAPAALALHNARLFEAEAKARQISETLSAAAQDLTKTLELDQVIDSLLDHLQVIVYCDTAGVTLLEDETNFSQQVVRKYGQWADQESTPTLPINGITDPVIRQKISDRKSFSLQNKELSLRLDSQNGYGRLWNWLVVPIIASDKVIGLVELGRVGEQDFGPELVQWSEALVSQAAVAIQNAWLFQQVRSSSERLQSLTRRLVEIQENERSHVARELHDEAGQALSLLKLNLGRLEQDPDCPAHVRQRLEDLKGVTDGVLEELHRLAVDLRPIALDHLGLVIAMEQYARNLDSEHLAVKFKALGFDGKRLPKDVEICFYRILQEGLANVIRHAQAGNVGILLEWNKGWVKLFVEDDGIGFDPDLPENKHRLGLIGIRERAEMFGGTLTIESSPGNGTSLIVEVPDANSYPYRG